MKVLQVVSMRDSWLVDQVPALKGLCRPRQPMPKDHALLKVW